MRRTTIGTAALAATVLAMLAATAQAQAQAQTPAPAADASDPLMMQRLATLPKARPWPIAWFQPQEVVPGVASPPMTVKPSSTIAPQALETARAYARATNTQAFLVWRNGRLITADYDAKTQPTDALNAYYTHFTVLTLLYGAAIRDGYIHSIDDKAARYLPEWANDDRRDITLRQLLTMTSGLEVYHDNVKPENKNTRVFFGSDTTAPALEYPLVSPPGTVFAYSYVIPEICGIILERATKQREADYLSKTLWKPIGARPATVWLDRPGGRPHFNSGLFATAEDWLRVGQLILNEGRVGSRQVIPASWVKTMLTPTAVNPNYGMIWIGAPYIETRRLAKDVAYTVHSSAPYAIKDLVFLDGYGGQRIYISRAKKLVVVRIGEVRRNDWDDATIPNALAEGLK